MARLAEANAPVAQGAKPIGVPKPQRERGQGQVFRGIDPGDAGAHRRGVPGGGRPAFGWPPPSPQSDGIAFSVRRLEAERVRGLRARGRAGGATLNDLLLAAYFRAPIALFDPPAGEPLPVQVPVDLRRYVPGKASAAVCNLSSAVWPAVTKDSAMMSFDRALAAVTESMAFLKADYPGIGAALYVDHVFSQPYSQAAAAVTENLRLANVRSHPYLSNLGVS